MTKARVPGYVYCIRHGCIHDEGLDPYGYVESDPSSMCTPSDHRAVYVNARKDEVIE